MKACSVIKLVVLFVCTFFCINHGMQGALLQSVPGPTPQSRSLAQLSYWVSSLPYVAGGVVFTYPVGLFIEAPIVQATVQGINAVAGTTVASARVTLNSIVSTTIVAEYIDPTSGRPLQAPAGTIINLLAIGV